VINNPTKKIILISGGMGYLAQNLVKLMNDENHFFILLDILNQKKAMKGKNIAYIFTDVSNGENVAKELEKFLEKRKMKIDGLVNTPAWNNFKNLQETSFADIKKIINTKLIGYTNTIKSSLVHLNQKASIVNVCSVQAHTTRDFGAMYSAANGGILSLTRALAVELREMQIRVNSVSPGGFDGDIYKKSHPDWQLRVKNGQCLSTNDVSKVIMFLLSDESIGINGAEIIVDGGISALRARSTDF
jgi:NAD(P)-dependent dehydrogenase (short-subunit alcohol dehydrogenase family)